LTEKTLETTDIFRGAFFLSSGGILEGAYLSEDNRQIVSFRIIGKNLCELDKAYRAGKATVNPLELKESLNLLRETLYNTLNKTKKH
jgi:hypothetical protein